MYCYKCMSEIGNAEVCYNCHQKVTTDIPPHHLKPGTVLKGRYVVGESLGEGGFGITYIGYDTTLAIKVAIKEYFPSGCSTRTGNQSQASCVKDKEELFVKGKDRFLQEARSIAKFNKEKGIVDVQNYFEENATAYIIMEYLDGETLSGYVKRHDNINAEKMFALMLPIMTSLDRIHKAGIIHRDISPDNIMYQTDGTLKLMDFGSARYFTENDKKMSIIIKPGYAPEEQYRHSSEQGPWTDVYGLCATMYKCITGITPDNGLDRLDFDKLKKPSQLNINISPELEEILMKGLAVKKENRFQYVSELIVCSANCIGLKTVEFPANDVSAYPAFANETHNKPENLTSYAEDTIDYSKLVTGETTDSQIYGDNFVNGASPSQPKQKADAKKTAAAVILTLLCIGMLVGSIYLVMNYLPESDNNSSYAVTEYVAENKVQTAEVPDIVGLKKSDAESELKAAGLKYEIKYEENKSVNKGYVISQSPASGKEVPKDEKITVYVSNYEKIASSGSKSSSKTTSSKSSKSALAMYCRASEYVTLRKSASRSSSSLAKVYSGERVDYLNKTSGDFYYVGYNGKKGYVLKDFFTKDKSASAFEKYYCRASGYCSLRSGPSEFSDEKSKIKYNEAVDVLSTSGDYYLVYFDGIKGYVLQNYFVSYKNPTPYDGNNSYNDSYNSNTTLYCIASDYATLRQYASKSSTGLLKIYTGESVTFLGKEENGFYYVLCDNIKGYVLKDYFSYDEYAPLNYGDD